MVRGACLKKYLVADSMHHIFSYNNKKKKDKQDYGGFFNYDNNRYGKHYPNTNEFFRLTFLFSKEILILKSSLIGSLSVIDLRIT